MILAIATLAGVIVTLALLLWLIRIVGQMAEVQTFMLIGSPVRTESDNQYQFELRQESEQ